MKFFWKLFFTTMFVSVICVALSGYLLIHSNFQSQLDSEVKTAQDYCEIVYYSLTNEFENIPSETFSVSATVEETYNIVSQIVQSININNMNQKIPFSIMDTNQEVLFSSLDVTLDKTMISSLNTENAGWTIKETENGIYIQTFRPAIYLDNVFYIETVRDITHIFQTQTAQYKTLIKIMLGMLVFAGTLTVLISKLLLKRIVALTEVTKTISEGNLSKRASTQGNDEITLLSENFNQMANHLETKIHELEEEAKRKELFVGSFSHELKTPLTSIIGYSDLLRQKELSAEQRYICADYIFTEGKRLEQLSMRLLDLIVLKKHTLNPVPTSIDEMLDEVKATIEPQLLAADIQFICNVEPAIISLEPELMKTVFINLISNARNAIETNGKITLIGRRCSQGYMIVLQDSGKGMEKEELKKITDAFYMVDKSRSRKQGGAGLGLAICMEILTLHGFDLSFDSIPNVGTTVTITMKESKS